MSGRRWRKAVSIALATALVATLVAFLLPQPAYADPDPGWAYRKKITFTSDSNKIPSTQSYFPVLISLSSDSDLATDAQDDGDDILFTSSDGTTQLDHEIEKFDGGTGELIAWVEVPSLSTGTVIYMYYGNGTCGSQQDVAHTWDEGTDASPTNNFKMVQHLEETSKTDGTYNDHLDSSSNDNDGEAENGVTMNATGKINGADDFDGADDDITVADAASLDITTYVTIEAWVSNTYTAETTSLGLEASSAAFGGDIKTTAAIANLDTDDELEIVIGSKDATYGLRVFDWDGTTLTQEAAYNSGLMETCNPVIADVDNDGTLEIIAGNAAGDLMVFNFNGSALTLEDDTPPTTATAYKSGIAVADVGGDSNLEIIAADFAGTLWVYEHSGAETTEKASYPLGGVVEACTPAIADVDNDGTLEIVIADATDLHVLNYNGIGLTLEDDIATSGVVKSSPAIADVDGDGTLEIVIASTATTSNLHVYHHLSDTLFEEDNHTVGKIDKGGPAIADVDNDGTLEIIIGDATANSLYVLSHNGTTITQENATPPAATNAIKSEITIADTDADGTLEILAAAKDGKVYVFKHDGSATTEETNYAIASADIEGSAPVVADVDNDESLEIVVADKTTDKLYILSTGSASTVTWPCSGKNNEHTAYLDYPFAAVNKEDAYGLMVGTANVIGIINETALSASLSSGWRHIAFTYDGTTQKLYVDGVESSQAMTGSINSNANNLMIGDNFKGTLDEVRISDTARSTDWIKTCYNNQNSPSTFYSVGSEEELDTTPPTFTIQYYSDAGLTNSLGDNPTLKAGTYYLKITADEALSGAPTITIDAEGSNNDVTGAATDSVSGNVYKYTRTIVTDAAAVGAVLEDISITGTDVASNAATDVDPTNEAAKAAYTDTTAPTITSGTVAADNTYIDVALSEGVYNTDSGSGALETSDFNLIFTQNGGNATDASISSVTNTSDGALSGGESTIRCVLSITGTPSGVETVEIKPVASSIYDYAGNAAADTETTTALNLYDKLAPTVEVYSPLVGATDAGGSDNLVLDFDDNMVEGSGDITIYEYVGDAEFEVIAVGSTSIVNDVVTINPVGTLVSGTKYYILIDATALDDDNSNSYAGISNKDTWNFTVADTAGPVITGGTLESNNTYVDVAFDEGVYGDGSHSTPVAVADFSLTFVANSGNASDASISSVTNTSDGALSGGESTIRCVLNITGTPSGVETVEIKPVASSIYDYAGNAAADTETTTAKTLNDQLAPTVVTYNPTDGATDVATDANLVLTFDDSMVKGTGNIVIYKYSDNSEVETIDVTTGQVTISTTQVTINPSVTFASETEYYVLIDATALDDDAGNSYAGISDKTTWNFTGTTPATVTLTAEPIQIPADGSSTSTLTATVKDQYGNNVADGTDVLFETDHGTFASSTVTKQTSGGVATATLTSESSAETVIATVTATANGVSDATAVFFIPEGGAEVEESKTETVCGSDTVLNAPTGGDVSIDATGCHTITVAKYEDIPGGTPTFQVTGDYYDVHLDDDESVESLTIQFCEGVTADTVIYYWDGSTWRRASDQRYSNGCIVVTITDSTSPSLSDLSGLPFASGTPYPPAPVGGEVYPVNKLAILMPWMVLFAAILAGASLLVLTRRRAQS